MLKQLLFTCVLTLLFLNLSSQISFEEKAEVLGIDRAYGLGNFGGGICFFDFNHDGWDDITMATGYGDSIYFYTNNYGVFEQIIPSPIPNTFRVKHILWADYDNDNDYDLFVSAHTQQNRLYKNEGGMNFIDVTVEAGIDTVSMYTTAATWGDVNNDGWLDLYLTIYHDDLSPFGNQLYLNNGDGTFTDIASSAGVTDFGGQTLGVVFSDFDDDGDQDLYLAVDRFAGNTVFVNNGDNTFEDVSQTCGGGIEMNAMCATPGDYDNDGDEDFYFSNDQPFGSKLAKNLGNATFEEVAEDAGVDWEYIGWGSVFLDADLDGDLDLFLSGMTNGSNNDESSIFYENMGDGTFIEGAEDSFQYDTIMSFSNATGDINNDGLLDIVVNNRKNTKVTLWENTTISDKNFIKIYLRGTVSNRDGIGSSIKVFTNGTMQYRYTHCGSGYLAQNQGYSLFGLNEHDIIDSIEVKWLSGIIDVIYDIPVNQLITIEEGAGISGVDKYIDNDNIFRIYPNPANDILVIEKLESDIEIAEIWIRNLEGRLIEFYDINRRQNRISLSLQNLSSGIYQLILSTEDGLITKKIIVIK